MRRLPTILIIALGTVTAAVGPAAAAWDARKLRVPRWTRPTPAGSSCHWDLPTYTLTDAVVDGRAVSVVDLPGSALRREAGCPELPLVTATVPLPGQGRVRLEVVAVRQHTIPVAPVIPSRGELTRDVDPAAAPRSFGPVYAAGGVWPSAAADLTRPFLLGARRGVTVRLQPLRYDAGRGVLVVTDHLELAVVTAGTGGANEAPAAATVAGPVLPALADRFLGGRPRGQGLLHRRAPRPPADGGAARRSPTPWRPWPPGRRGAASTWRSPR